MANFKRRRPRTAPSGGYSANALDRRLGGPAFWLSNHPRFWDNIHHTRPRRAEERLKLRAVLAGGDPDATVWPDGRKPHIYFW